MAKMFFAFILIFLLFIYRQAIFGNKIIFPSNFLASFYSPWSTEKFPGWEQGVPNKPLGGDQLRFFYPGRTFSNEEIKAGRVPLWNPYILTGNPHLANFQSAIFYPLNSLYLFLPQLTAWSLLIIIQPFLAAIFCFLFLTCFPIKKMAAMFGAFAFGFSGFIIAWSQEAMAVGHSVIWLPLILYGVEKKKFLVATVALTFSILAGYLQTTVYVSAFVFFYALYRRTEIKKIITIFFLAIGLSAIQIVPSLESFSLSARPTATIEKVFDTYLLPIIHLVKLIAPDIEGNPGVYNYFGKGSYNETVLFIGVVPLVFAIFALRKKTNSPVKFFLFSGVISYLLTSNFFLTRWFLHLPLPLIPTFQPSRILILTTFSLAVLSAFGLEFWLKNQKRDYKIIRFICLGLATILFLALSYYYKTLWQRDFLIVVKNAILSLAILIILILRKPSLLIIIVLTVFGQLYFFNKYLILGDKQFFYPKNQVFEYLKKDKLFDRFITLGEPILGNFGLQEKLFSPEGYDPIFSKRYGQLIYAGRDFMNGKISENLPRIEVIMSQAEKSPENFRRSRLLSLLGVKNILYFNNQWQFSENKQALPRTFLADEIVVETNPQKILDRIFDEKTNLEKTLILEENIPITLDQNKGIAKISSYEPQKVEIETQTSGPKVLFLSDNFYPGWKATVDNQETKIYRADYSFRAVIVSTGKHKVTFRYEPQSFEIGKNITLVALLLLFFQSFRRSDKFRWKLE